MEAIITLHDDALSDLDAMRARLQAAGASAVQINKITGTASAQIGADRLEHVRAVPGVLAVEPSGDVQIPPPESPIQ
jgi:hypothetical protein